MRINGMRVKVERDKIPRETEVESRGQTIILIAYFRSC